MENGEYKTTALDISMQKGKELVGLVGLCMVFNVAFNNISVILWRSVLLVKETTDLSHVTDKLLSHNVVSSTPRHERGLNSQL
jgi:hypothetical protein